MVPGCDDPSSGQRGDFDFLRVEFGPYITYICFVRRRELHGASCRRRSLTIKARTAEWVTLGRLPNLLCDVPWINFSGTTPSLMNADSSVVFREDRARMGHSLSFPSFADEDPKNATGFWCF